MLEHIDDSNMTFEPILITNDDRFGTDVNKMSNFFQLHIKHLVNAVTQSCDLHVLEQIPVADFGIIESILSGLCLKKGQNELQFNYVADLDALPENVKEMLRSGKYKLGESRQTPGNCRAVIVDENGKRVKDITFKAASPKNDTIINTQSIMMQMELRQINEVLEDIQMLQRYQIQRTRNQDQITPFLTARDYLLKSEMTTDFIERNSNLEKAFEYLSIAVNAVAIDLSVDTERFSRETNKLFRKSNVTNEFVEYIIKDIQFLTKFIGLQLAVCDRMGNPEQWKIVFDKYSFHLKAILSNPVNSRSQSAVDLLQLYTPYTKNNCDFWIDFKNEASSLVDNDSIFNDDKKKICIIQVEDINEETNPNQEVLEMS